MQRVQRPTENAADVFLTCISRVRNRDLRRRLTSVVADIETAANAFETAADTNSYYTLQPHNNVNGIVTGDQMVDVYELRMVLKTAPGRAIYDRLLAQPAHGRCPLCGQRDVSTLDHYLPKSDFPALAVVPINLVPSCKDCNLAKQGRPHTAEEQTLHPYFDDVENELWLSAEVVQGSPAVLHFFVTPPASWDRVMSERVRHHFEVFQLAKLYASHSAERLTDMRRCMNELFATGGSQSVADHLQRMGRSILRVNSWRSAMYRALGSNDWFCNGGFRN